MKQVVIKSNGLIEARYKLTLEEQRIVLYIVSLIESQDKDFKKYEVDIKTFSELANLTRNNQYGKFKKISKSLMSKTITILEGKRTIIVSWLSSSVYDIGTGKIYLSFDPELKPYLLQLKRSFTRYKLENVLYLKSIYAVRLYELLKQYEKIKSRIFDLNELKAILCVDTLPAYKDYFNFKTKVILPAERELKEKCDIYFEYQEFKEGRRIAKIKFDIFKNNIDKSIKPILSKNDSSTNNYINQLKGIIKEPLSEKEFLSIIEAAHGDISLIQNRYNVAKEKREIDNLAGFMIWACQQSDEQFKKIKINKNNFNNLESHDRDFEQIEKMEQEYLIKTLSK